MKMHKKSGAWLVLKMLFLASVVSSLTTAVNAAPLPDTLKIPVTFYDFHSDSSNPEFEIIPQGTPIERNMVANTLDSDKKPVLGANPYYNRRIDRWFRPWVAGDFNIYNYYSEYAGTPNRYNRYSIDLRLPSGNITLSYDTSFKNIVIQDTLIFRLVNAATGTYEFLDTSFFPLDSRGFGNEGRIHNYSFAMELHWEFTKMPGLRFTFSGDDDVWAFIDDQLRMDLGGIHAAQRDSINLDQIPGLVDDSLYFLDFFYVERHVTQSSIRITTNIVSRPPTLNIDISPNDTICALTQVDLTSKVTSDTGERVDLENKTVWRITTPDGQPDSALKQTIGKSVSFIAQVAYSTVVIEATTIDGDDTLRKSVTLYIRPCDEYKIWIEANPVDTNNITALRFPQEMSEVSMDANQTIAHAYAIARDRSGAYVRLADPLTTQWSINNTALATVAGEPGKKYHGIFTRLGSEGNTMATATESGLLSDDVPVIISAYTIVELQLRDSLNNVVTSINMMTDDDSTYYVWGLKSTAKDNPGDPSSWVPTKVNWELLNSAIILENALQGNLDKQTISPKTAGYDTLHLSKPEGTPTLDIPIRVGLSGASRVEIELITPAPRRAGDTLLLEVRIYNTDGLIPGEYCFGDNGNNLNKAIYSDRLGVGNAGQPYPTVTINDVNGYMNVLNQTAFKYDQCFIGGIDTLKTVLFYAPYTENGEDSLHQITVSFGEGSDLTDKTIEFVLLPSVLAEIRIEDANGIPLSPQTLTGNESVTPYADGYDRYKNRIGFIESQWSTTGTLDRIDDTSTFTYITAEGVPTDQHGDVCAEKVNEIGETIKGCLAVTIIGPKKQVASALTRDLDGDGLLDAIEFKIDRAVTLSEISYSNFTDIIHGSTRFSPDSISIVDSNTIRVHFHEKDTTVPQTGWTLYYSIVNSATLGPVSQARTSDGAGPVIWKAIYSIKDKKNPNLKIYLSEKVKNQEFNTMNYSDDPSITFNVFEKGSNVPSTILDNIKRYDGVSDSVLTIKIPEAIKSKLSDYYYINLDSLSSSNISIVQDLSHNLPLKNNIKRQIEVEGQEQEMKVGPNPTDPNFEHTAAGVLTLENDTSAYAFAEQGKGTVIQVKLFLDTMSATLQIHDMVGNLVNSIHVPDFLTYLKDAAKRNKGLNVDKQKATIVTLAFYWNGSNSSGMAVSPGVYRVVFYANYKNSKYKDFKFVDVAGIGKGTKTRR